MRIYEGGRGAERHIIKFRSNFRTFVINFKTQSGLFYINIFIKSDEKSRDKN